MPWAPGLGSPCPCGTWPLGTSGFPACPRLDALGLAAAGAQGFESGPQEGAHLGRPRSGGPAANMLRKGELEPQGQVGVGWNRAEPEALGAVERQGNGSRKQPPASWLAFVTGTRRAPAAGAGLSVGGLLRDKVFVHGSSGQASGVCLEGSETRVRSLWPGKKKKKELASWDLCFAIIKFWTYRVHPLRGHPPLLLLLHTGYNPRSGAASGQSPRGPGAHHRF